MRNLGVLLLFLLATSLLFAADKQKVQIEVLSSDGATVGAGAVSTGSATTIGGTTTGHAMAIPLIVISADMDVKIDGEPATLHCDTMHYRKCFRLRPGTYEAVIDGNTAHVTTYNWRKQKQVLKYKVH